MSDDPLTHLDFTVTCELTAPYCRDVAQTSETRPATLTGLGRVAEVRQSMCV